MSNEKILKVMAEVNGEVCERGELIHGIALALLTRKNLFVLPSVFHLAGQDHQAHRADSGKCRIGPPGIPSDCGHP